MTPRDGEQQFAQRLLRGERPVKRIHPIPCGTMVVFRTATHRTQLTRLAIEHNLLRGPLPGEHAIAHRAPHRRIPHNRHPMPPLHTHRIQPGTHPTFHHTQPGRVRRHDPFTHLTAHRRHPTRQTIHTHCTSHAATNRTCTPMRPPPAPPGGPPPWRQPQTWKTRKTKSHTKAKTSPPTPPHSPTQPTTTYNEKHKTNQRITSAHQHTQHRQPTNEEQEPRTMHHQRIRTTIFREGLERIKAKNTGICRGATHCAPVGTKGAGQHPSRNKVAAHCTAPSTVSNASVRTLPCPSSACTVRRAPSTPDCPGGRMRSFHGLGAPLRVARII